MTGHGAAAAYADRLVSLAFAVFATLVCIVFVLFSRWACAQPYFRERDGGTRTWDAGRWPNPGNEDRLRDYPVVQP